MRNLTNLTWPVCAVAGIAATVTAGGSSGGAEPATLDVTGNATINAEIQTFIGQDSLSATNVDVMGTITMLLDGFQKEEGKGGGDLELVDLDLMFVPAVQLSGGVDGGEFLGSANPVSITLEGMSLVGPEPLPSTEGPSIATFLFDAAVSGNAVATYNLIGIDPQEANTINLADVGATNAMLDIFTLNRENGTVTVEATLTFETVSVPFEPGLVEINISNSSQVNLTATGEDPGFNPADFCSRADIAESCGTLDLADITTFVAGFTSEQPVADFNGDGSYDLADITGFISAFTNDVCDEAGVYYCYSYNGMAAIEFHEGNAAYAMGNHTMLTASIAVSGAALMLGFGSFRRKTA